MLYNKSKATSLRALNHAPFRNDLGLHSAKNQRKEIPIVTRKILNPKHQHPLRIQSKIRGLPGEDPFHKINCRYTEDLSEQLREDL